MTEIHHRIYITTGKLSAIGELLRHADDELPRGTLANLAGIIDDIADELNRAGADAETLEGGIQVAPQVSD